MPQTYPSFDEAVEHQQRWGSPPVGDQLGNIASTTAGIPWNTLMAGPKFMQSYASGEIPEEKAGPEAFKTMLGYMGMGSVLGGRQAVNESVLNALKLSKLKDLTPNLSRHSIINDDGKAVGTTELYWDPVRKDVGINNIKATVNPHGEYTADMPNSLGLSNIRSLLKGIKHAFPTAETASGYRFTGAREKAGMSGMHTTIKLPKDRN